MLRMLLAVATALAAITFSAGVADASTITLGSLHACGVRSDATLTCWGRSDEGQTTAPAGTFTAVSAGVWASSNCGLRTDGTLACWGSGYGAPPAGTFTAVASSAMHGCAIRTDETVACWGSNSFGETSAPGGEFKAIAVGWLHSCGIRSDRTVACWGADNNGQTPAPAGTFREIGTGEWHSCGIRTDQTIACWGSNDYGESAPPAGTFTSLSVGINHSCALRTTDGTAVCWGQNSTNQLAAPPNETFTEVTAGRLGSCGRRPDGSVVCWGDGAFGELEPPADTFASPELVDETAPEITPVVSGTLGDDDWYTSDVEVAWTVDEPDTQPTLATDGCDATTIDADTSATTLTCDAESEGGVASRSVTVKRDATAPAITIDVPDYRCDDDGSGVDTCDGVTTDAGPGRKTLTVTATDHAGNESTDAVTYAVAVPSTPRPKPRPAKPAPAAPLAPVVHLRAGQVSLFGRHGATTRCVVDTGTIDACQARLVARGHRIAVGNAASPTVRLRLTDYGRALLARQIGGVRATLKLRSGTLRASARTRAMLRVEHVTTPPGAWTASKTTLSARGERFVRSLRGKLVRVAAIRCDGHAADRAPGLTSVGISRARAATMCAALGLRVPAKVVGHGDTQPVAGNDSEAGRAANRRVELTITHRGGAS